MSLHKGNPIVAGIGLIVALAVLVALAVSINLSFGLPLNLSLGWPPGTDYTLRAYFKDTNGVVASANVVVAGTPVGQVTNVQASGRQAMVSMRIDRSHAPVRKGTIATIRYSTLLAQKYVELTPAAKGATLASDSIIPSTDTLTPVDFDQFLSTFDPETRARLQTVVQQAGGGVDGQATAISSFLDQLDQLSVESRGGLSTFHANDPQLQTILGGLAVTSTRLAQSRVQLGDFIDHTGQVTGTVAGQDQSLQGLIVHLAGTMGSFDSTLNGEEGNFHSSVVAYDPFQKQLGTTLGTVYPYLHGNLGVLQQGINVLLPEIGSAISQTDANGNYLRQYLINDGCYDSINSKPSDPQASNDCAPGSAANAPAPPAPPSGGPTAPRGSIPGRNGACPTPSPTPTAATRPTPTPTEGPCPTPLPPCLPIPGLPTPTPIPTPSIGTCIPVPGGINPPDVTLPAGVPTALPSMITDLTKPGGL